MRVSSRSRTRVFGRWKGVFLASGGGVLVLDDWRGEGEESGSAVRMKSTSFALPLARRDDQADLRLSQTMRKTRMKKIWSIMDSRWDFERGIEGSGGGVGGGWRDGEEWARRGLTWGNRNDFVDQVLTRGNEGSRLSFEEEASTSNWRATYPTVFIVDQNGA